jgi:hypothetical protein
MAKTQTIKPPAGFILQKANGTTRIIDHYVKGTITFMADDWTGPEQITDSLFDADVAKFLSVNYRTSLTTDLHFSKGIYYGVAHYSGMYIFTVLDNGMVYKITSIYRDANFKRYSNWLLQQSQKKKPLQ